MGGLRILEEGIWYVFLEARGKFCTHLRRIGDMIYMEALGHRILVLNSPEDCTALMEQRAVNYSDRAEIPVVDMSVLLSSSQKPDQ